MQKRTDLVEHLCVYFRDLRQNQQNFLKKQGFTGEIDKKDQNWHKNCIKNKTAENILRDPEDMRRK